MSILIAALPTRARTLASLLVLTVKSLPAVLETRVESVGWINPLEKGNVNPLWYSSLENSMNREAW